MNGEGEDAGVVYCEMQGRENMERSRTYLNFVREMYPGHCGYKVITITLVIVYILIIMIIITMVMINSEQPLNVLLILRISDGKKCGCSLSL